VPRTDHTRVVFFSLLLAGMAFALSQTVVSPALPEIQRQFGADLFGRGKVLTVVLLIFAVGSAVCALAPSLGVLVAGRIIQGVGGGIFPLAFGIIRETFPPERVATAIGGISATFGIGGGVGLVIAGLIVEALDASWLFWLGLMALPAAFVIVAVLWGWMETKIDQPLVDMRVLRRRPVLMTNITAVLVGFSMFASFLLIPQLAQTPRNVGYGFGASVTGAGLLMLPSTLIMLVAGPWAGRLATRASSRLPLVIGTFFGMLAFIFYALFHDTEWEICVGGALLGIGIGFSFASMANLVVESVPREEVGVATGINTIMRSLGGALGAQLVASLLVGKTIANTSIPAEAAYTDAFIVAAVAAGLAMLAALAIPHTRRPQAQAVTAPAAA
jgi:MFS family permease